MILTSDHILNHTAGKLHFDTPDCSFSPLYSSIGLLADKNGPGALVLHYNRYTRTLFRKTVKCGFNLNEDASDMTKLVFGNGEMTISFFAKNAFMVEAVTNAEIGLLFGAGEGVRYWFEDPKEGSAFLFGFTETPENRDPDRETPFALRIRAVNGSLHFRPGALNCCPSDGLLRVVFVFSCLEIDKEEMQKRCASAPANVETAAQRCRIWAKKASAKLNVTVQDDSQIEKISLALAGLLFNLTQAEGKLRGHISAFPSRGTYPTHFLWDTCFQNLAYEMLNPDLAKDLLLQNIDNQRPDGKFAQFLCSTWERPHDSQPALIGWAGLRVFKLTEDLDFAEKLLHAIIKNNNWWLTNRRTDCGLIYTLGGLETGQDNSPRFDAGPTIAADMNAYLLQQLYTAAQLAETLHNPEHTKLLEIAERYEEKLWQILWDADDTFFYDLDLQTRSPIKIVSPAGILPLWASHPGGSQIGCAKECIEKYLLSEKYLFGDVPFPSVAYADTCYVADDWWRGPTWMPIAYLMLELLEKYGYKEESRNAAKRLYDVIAADDRVSELFNSRTGQGLGAAQQGWTCSIFLKLTDDLNGGNHGLL